MKWNNATTNPPTTGLYLVCVGRANKTGGIDGRLSEFAVRLAWFLGNKWELTEGVFFEFRVTFWMPIPQPPCKPGEYWHYKDD